MKKLIVLTIMLVCVNVSSVFAGQYVTGKLGVYFPDESAFDDGTNVEAAFGWDYSDLFPGAATQNPVLKNVTLEAGIGYYEADFSENTPFGRVKGDLSVVPLTLTGIYHHPLSGTDFNLYGGAGLGLYFSEVDVRVDGLKDDDSSVEFGMRLVGGGEYLIRPQFSFGAELRLDLVSDDVGGVFVNVGGKYRF